MPLRRYIVHCADGDTPRARWVEGVTIEDAALAFPSEWDPYNPHEGVGLIVCHAASGEKHAVSVDRRRHDHKSDACLTVFTRTSSTWPATAATPTGSRAPRSRTQP